MTTIDYSAPVWTDKIYVDGGFRAASGGTMPATEKATGRVLGSTGSASAEDVAEAVRAAVDAKARWASLQPSQRADYLLRVAVEIEARRDEILTLICRETGGIRFKAELEVRLALGHLRQSAALAVQPHTHEASSVVPGRRNLVQRRPLGAIAIITPWNLPFALAFSPIAPALALGNTVVLKPAPQTPLVGGTVLAEVFDAAGLPPGVFNVVHGGDETGRALVADPRLDMIRFTGSTSVGKAIAKVAAARLTPVSLELGGNAAFVVLDDADVDKAAMAGAWSSFHFSGQTCITAGRHIVMRPVAEKYIQALAQRAARLVVADPMDDVDMGPLIDEEQAARVEQLLSESVDAGAHVVTGGTRDGLFFRPTVVTDVTPGMPVFDQEVFGPIAPVIVVDTEEEALELANATPYGLTNAVFSGDTWRAWQFAEQMESGMVHVNDATNLSEPTIPFGGWHDSGLGPATGAEANIEQFTKARWVSIQRSPMTYRY